MAREVPVGSEPMSLHDIEKRYEKDFPLWYKDFQCFPEAPIFYDKLFKKEPLTRAIDIENKLLDLKTKVKVQSHIPFDFTNDNDDTISRRTVDEIIQNLQELIKYLKLTNNSRIKNGLPKVLNSKVNGKLVELKDPTKTIETIKEIQEEAFDMVIANDKTCREEKGYYEMR